MSAPKPIRVAILGAGFIGQAHILALRQLPGVTVDLLIDRDPANAERKARYWGIPRSASRWEDAFSDTNIEAVHNCLPNREHAAVVAAAIRSGKALFTEKPLTRTFEEARELAAMAGKSRAPIGVNYNYRYYPMVERFREAVQGGAIGTPVMVVAQYLQDWMTEDAGDGWRSDPARGGPSRALWDIGSHVLDLIEYVLGDPIETVHAVAGRKTKAPAAPGLLDDDYTLMLLETQGGLKGTASVSQVSPGHRNDLRLEVNGTKASLAWRQEAPETLWNGRPGDRTETWDRTIPGDFRSGTRLPYPPGHVVGWPDAMRLAISAFYEDVAGVSTRVRRVPLQDGLRSMAVLAAVIQSATTGTAVRVEGFDQDG